MTDSCDTRSSCREKLISGLKKSLPVIAGIILGATGGYLYYLKVGCSTGSCPITSNPYISVLWGAAIGYLAAGIIKPSKKKEKPDEVNGGKENP